jgi:hypothetical protein
MHTRQLLKSLASRLHDFIDFDFRFLDSIENARGIDHAYNERLEIEANNK